MFDAKFIEENLPKILGIHSIPEDKKQKVIEAMQKHIQTQLASKIMGQLNMRDKMKLMPLMMKRNPEEIMKFMVEKVPNFQEIVQKEVMDFKPQALKIINES